MFRMMPEQASEVAPKIDWLIYIIMDLSILFTVLICGAMLYFAWKYRKRNGKDHETPQIHGSHLLELVWTVVPTIICIYVAYYGVAYYFDLRRVPAPGEGITVNVQAQKWKWDVAYDNGKKTTGEVVVPVSTPIKIVLTSRDVLHSFFIPAMRVKSDAVPGMYTYVAFTPVKTGTYQVFCTEYCGKEHSTMMAKVRVVTANEYETWLNDRSAEFAAQKMSPIQRGRQLYTQKGCNACHSIDGSRLVGPSFLKIFGRQGTYEDGGQYVADESYIRESVYEPNKHIVSTYPPNLMVNYTGQLDEDELAALIAFMKSLDGSAPVVAAPAAPEAAVDESLSPADRGKKLFSEKLCATCHSLDGSKLVGPSLKGLYGRKSKMTSGDEVVSDAAYIKESILNPAAKVVEGYPPAMPPYQGQLNDQQIDDIIEFIRTVK